MTFDFLNYISYFCWEIWDLRNLQIGLAWGEENMHNKNRSSNPKYCGDQKNENHIYHDTYYSMLNNKKEQVYWKGWINHKIPKELYDI